MLTFKINDLVGQEVGGKFSDIVTFSRINVDKKELNLEDDYKGDVFRLVIVWSNSRTTKLTCSENTYNTFNSKWDEYNNWLSKNPMFEQSRIDMSLFTNILRQTIEHSSKNTEIISKKIVENLIEVNEKISNKAIDIDKSFSTSMKDKIDTLEKGFIVLGQSMSQMNEAILLIKEFVPMENKDDMEEETSMYQSEINEQ